jgi:hypothetical protein
VAREHKRSSAKNNQSVGKTMHGGPHQQKAKQIYQAFPAPAPKIDSADSAIPDVNPETDQTALAIIGKIKQGYEALDRLVQHSKNPAALKRLEQSKILKQQRISECGLSH